MNGFILALALLSGCSSNNDIRGFWNSKDVIVTESNYREQRERFADFAVLATSGVEKDAKRGLDALFAKLRNDEVSYYVYEEWMEAAFYSIHSPTHSPALFEHAAARIESDGMMPDQAERIRRLRYYNSLNQAGSHCTLPPGVPAEGPATILVVDASCRTCTGALSAVGSAREGRSIAIYFGTPETPSVSGWDYFYCPPANGYFDTQAAPFYFVIDAQGIVTQSYSPVSQPKFATPE